MCPLCDRSRAHSGVKANRPAFSGSALYLGMRRRLYWGRRQCACATEVPSRLRTEYMGARLGWQFTGGGAYDTRGSCYTPSGRDLDRGKPGGSRRGVGERCRCSSGHGCRTILSNGNWPAQQNRTETSQFPQSGANAENVHFTSFAFLTCSSSTERNLSLSPCATM